MCQVDTITCSTRYICHLLEPRITSYGKFNMPIIVQNNALWVIFLFFKIYSFYSSFQPTCTVPSVNNMLEQLLLFKKFESI